MTLANALLHLTAPLVRSEQTQTVVGDGAAGEPHDVRRHYRLADGGSFAMADTDAQKSFWTSIPGILTGIAAVIAAVGGLLTVISRNQPLVTTPTQQEAVTPKKESAAVILQPDPYYLANPDLLLTQKNVHGDVQLGRVYWQQDVWIGGERYQHAIGMHAPDNGIGHAEFSIPRGAKYFRSIFGIARDDKSPEAFGDAIGRISIDNAQVWERNTAGLTAIETPAIEIPDGSRVLKLEVDSKGSNRFDQTAWGNPRFTNSR